MSEFTTADFWVRAFERAVKTAAQTAVMLAGADGADVLSLDFGDAAVMVVTSFVLSILTSVASTRVGDPEDPSLV